MSILTIELTDDAPAAPDTRRAFIARMLAAGFALATHPIAAQTVVHTAAEGIHAGDVAIPATDSAVPAYRSKPRGDGPHPVVIVVHEIFGVHEHIRDVTRGWAILR